jgi:hypothetical protein
MNDCNEWKTDKHYEFTNIAQLQVTQIMVPTVSTPAALIFVMQSVQCTKTNNPPPPTRKRSDKKRVEINLSVTENNSSSYTTLQNKWKCTVNTLS